MITSMKKIMATVLNWDAQGVILVDFLPNGQTINANRYIATLKRLKHAVRRKCSGLRDDQIDNTRPHAALQAQEAIQSWVGLSFHILHIARI